MFSLDLVAFSSSIQSGWNQWSLGILPNSTFASVNSVMRLIECMGLWGNERKIAWYELLEVFCKVIFVQEDVGVLIFLVEAVLYLVIQFIRQCLCSSIYASWPRTHLLNTRHDPIQVAIPRQNDKRRIRPGSRCSSVHVMIVILRNASLVRRLVGQARELSLDVRNRGGAAILFMWETEDEV